MNRRPLAVVIRSTLLLAVACLTRGEQVHAQPAGPLVAPAPFRTEDPSDRGLDANLYMQTSAEYRACCYQTYHLATSRLRPALAGLAPGAKPAVVMDLDETVFDNAGFQSSQLRQNLAFDVRSWDIWESKHPDEVRLVPGVKEFILAAESLGYTVIHISNRKHEYRVQARSALARLGIPVKGDHQLRLSTTTTDKTDRRRDVENEYAVLLYVGDNLRDFDERFRTAKLPAKTPEAVTAAIQARKDQVDADRANWGDRWIILPNPAYGEWTSPLKQGRGDLDRLAPSMGGMNTPDAGSGADDFAIRGVVQAYVDARTLEDAPAIEALFTPDADQLVSDGTRRRGRPELVQGMLESSRKNPAKRLIAIQTVRLLSPEIALVDGQYRQLGADGGPNRDMQTTLTLKRTPDGWKIAAIRNMLPAAPAVPPK